MRALACLLLCALLTGCAARKELITEQVPVVLRDTLVVKEARLDSVRVLERVERLGDTVHHWHTVYRERRASDTVLRVRTDTITVTRTRTVEVERRAPWWQTALGWVGGIGVPILAAIGVLIALRRR